LLTQWAAEKAIEAAGGIPVRLPVCWQKVEKQEIQERQVIRESFGDVKIRGRDN